MWELVSQTLTTSGPGQREPTLQASGDVLAWATAMLLPIRSPHV